MPSSYCCEINLLEENQHNCIIIKYTLLKLFLLKLNTKIVSISSPDSLDESYHFNKYIFTNKYCFN